MDNTNIKNLQYKKILKPSLFSRTVSAKPMVATTYDSKKNQKPKLNIKKIINIDKKIQNQEISKKRASSTILNRKEIISRYPQLFNNHNHKEDCSSIDQISWVINLREYNDNKKKIEKKNNNLLEPSFYKDDLDNFMKKKLKKSKSTFDVENVPIFHKISFLFRKKISDMHGSMINKGLLNYQLNLRNNDIKEKNNWNSSNKIKYENIFDTNKEMFKKRICRNKSENSKETLKKYVSSIPYNDKYIERNFCKIEYLLNRKNQTQQNIWFQLGLHNN